MLCPQCQAKTKVRDTRPERPQMVVRQRVCPECFHVFQTAEIPARPQKRVGERQWVIDPVS